MRKNSQPDYECLFKSKFQKILISVVVITGDASCGKSKILQRFVDEKFEEKSHATIGVEFIPKNVVL